MKVLMVAAFAAAIAACDGGTAAGEGALVSIDEAHTGPVALVRGQPLDVRLKSQMGTGFSWTLETPKGDSLASLGNSVEARPAGAPPLEGGTEVQVFHFKAQAPGNTVLAFAYRRPWLSDPPAKRFQLTVSVSTAP